MVYLALILASSVLAHAQPACDGLLLNAEPFGFGPTAAIRQIAPGLRAEQKRLGYIGEGHTLDLQGDFAYDDVVELPSNADDETVLAKLRELRENYAYFFSAIDFRYARLAGRAGFKVGVYDPLFWFWDELPAEIENLDLYAIQIFAGVGRRVLRESSKLPTTVYLVPPLTPRLQGTRVTRRKSHALINLGGLKNPFLPENLTEAYAVTLANLCEKATKGLFQRRQITAKPQLVDTVPKSKRLLPGDVQKRLERVRLALMTPGLGSLFEASSARTPVVWLPPSHDSQGRQVVLLERRDMIDARLSWGEITGLEPIDYFQPQAKVMAEIAARMRILIESKDAQRRFVHLLRESIVRVMGVEGRLKLTKVVRKMGQEGAVDLAEMINVWITPTTLDGPFIEYIPDELEAK